MTDVYKGALDALPDAVFLADSDYRVIYFNRLFSELFRPEKAEVSLGDALSCAEKTAECGKGEACGMCSLRAAVRRAYENPFGTYVGRVEKCVRQGKNRLSVCFELSVSRVGEVYLGYLSDVRGRDTDLDMASAERFQRGLLPDKKASGGAFDYLYLPVRSVGGDMLDVFEREGRKCAFIADVSGKGVAAAMLTAFIKATFRRDLPPAAALTFMQSVYRALGTDERSYITALTLAVDRQKGSAEFASAGHNVPLLRRRRGCVTAHYAPAPPVSGWFDEVCYRSFRLDAEEGDLFVLATDGVTELEGRAGGRFGLEGLKGVLAQSETPDDFCARLSRALGGFSDRPTDDVTALALRV